MSRLGIVMFFATALLASASLTRLSSDATAQEKTLWQQLIGPWDLVSCTNKQNPICSNPSGSVVYTVSGRYMVMLTEKGRPIEVANFGTWSVDEATKTLSYRVESALVPKSFVVQYGEGSENKFPISSLTGDELKYSGATLGEIIWHRHGPAFVQPVSQTNVAQQKSLKEQLVGTWIMTSCDPKQPYCPNADGSLSYGPNGRYTWVILSRDRPKVSGTGPVDRAVVSAEQYKAMGQGTVAQFGTWSVNEADKTLTQHAESSFFGAGSGSDVKLNISFTGDELKTVFPSGSSFTWKKTPPPQQTLQ